MRGRSGEELTLANISRIAVRSQLAASGRIPVGAIADYCGVGVRRVATACRELGIEVKKTKRIRYKNQKKYHATVEFSDAKRLIAYLMGHVSVPGPVAAEDNVLPFLREG